MQATAMLGQNRKSSNRANSSAVRPLTDIRQCYIAHLPVSRIFSNSLPIGTTRTPQKSSRSCRTMNVASLFDRFGGLWMVGAFWFLPILRIGPIPTRAVPWINARSRSGVARLRLSASRQDVAHVARVPAATALSQCRGRSARRQWPYSSRGCGGDFFGFAFVNAGLSSICPACSAFRKGGRLDCFRASCPCPDRHWRPYRPRWRSHYRFCWDSSPSCLDSHFAN